MNAKLDRIHPHTAPPANQTNSPTAPCTPPPSPRNSDQKANVKPQSVPHVLDNDIMIAICGAPPIPFDAYKLLVPANDSSRSG